MQLAVWLVGLMCHLSALLRDTLQHRLHPKQGSDPLVRAEPSGLSRPGCNVWCLGCLGCLGCPGCLGGVHAAVAGSQLSFFSPLQRASSGSCHRMKSSPRCA